MTAATVPNGGSATEGSALQACMAEALAQAPGMALRWAAGLADVLRQQQTWSAQPQARADLAKAHQLLVQYKQQLQTDWPLNWECAMSDVCRSATPEGRSSQGAASRRPGPLALMDEAQVHVTVHAARLNQALQDSASHVLSELTALVSRAQGLAVARTEYNPLRPEVALLALQRALDNTFADETIRSLWLQHGAPLLAQELQVLYHQLVRTLTTRGLDPVALAVVHGPQSPRQLTSGPQAGAPDAIAPPAPDAWTPFAPRPLPPDRLLSPVGSGGTAQSSPVATPGRRSAGSGPISQSQEPRSVRGPTPSPADTTAETLAMELVQLALDGASHDVRHLPPLRDALLPLKPALLRIAQLEPRFFAGKQSPARRLMDDIIQRSLGFNTANVQGFTPFVGGVVDVVNVLAQAEGDAASWLDAALAMWQPHASMGWLPNDEPRRLYRVATLFKAEQRFLLAQRLADEVAQRPDFKKAHPVVQRFVRGAWAQVRARAHLDPAPQGPGRVPSDVRYAGVLTDLLWSSRVERTRDNPARLTRLMPPLLRVLREGLQTLDWDATDTRQFFSALMTLHEAGLKPLASPVASAVAHASSESGYAAPLWLRASEAAETGFLAVHPTSGEGDADLGVKVNFSPEGAKSAVPDLKAGASVSFCQSEGEWVDLQLMWRSPHGHLYLFMMGAAGKPVSMTRPGLQALWRSQRMALSVGPNGSHVAVNDVVKGVLDPAPIDSARLPLLPEADTAYPDLLPPLS